jgi:hypothetical protein
VHVPAKLDRTEEAGELRTALGTMKWARRSLELPAEFLMSWTSRFYRELWGRD